MRPKRSQDRERFLSTPLGLAPLLIVVLGSLPEPLAAAAQSQAEAPPALCLEEAFSLDISKNRAPRGLATTPTGLTVIWAADSLIVIDEEAVHARALPDSTTIIGVGEGHASLELLEANPSRLWRLSTDRDSWSPSPVELPWAPEAALLTGEGWVVAKREGDDLFLATLVGEGPQAVRPIPIVSDSMAPSPEPRVFLRSGSRGEVLVTTAAYPFSVYRYALGSDSAVHVGPPLTHLDGTDSVLDLYSLVSLPALAVGDAVLQTLVDLRSDARVLLLYGDALASPHVRHINAPLTFVGTRPALRQLIAIRDTDRKEVVFYDWRWSRGLPCPGS